MTTAAIAGQAPLAVRFIEVAKILRENFKEEEVVKIFLENLLKVEGGNCGGRLSGDG